MMDATPRLGTRVAEKRFKDNRLALAIVSPNEELRLDYEPTTEVLTIMVNRTVFEDNAPVVKQEYVRISLDQQRYLSKLLHDILDINFW